MDPNFIQGCGGPSLHSLPGQRSRNTRKNNPRTPWIWSKRCRSSPNYWAKIPLQANNCYTYYYSKLWRLPSTISSRPHSQRGLKDGPISLLTLNGGGWEQNLVIRMHVWCLNTVNYCRTLRLLSSNLMEPSLLPHNAVLLEILFLIQAFIRALAWHVNLLSAIILNMICELVRSEISCDNDFRECPYMVLAMIFLSSLTS
jgi:hypothetical protein